jgi:uncharacterized membrane protein YeaQ/YmgE (transglycosylase-associated protein family)
MLLISPSAFAPPCLFRDLEYNKAIILFYVDKGELSHGPSVDLAPGPLGMGTGVEEYGSSPIRFIGGAGNKRTVPVLHFLFLPWDELGPQGRRNSRSSFGNLNLPAYPRRRRTFEGGDDSILTPEDQWKYTTRNWQGGCMLMDIVWFLLIGLVAGWLASLITKREHKGIVNYLIIGVVGAFLGGFVFRILHLVAYGLLGELVIATAGAVILLFLLRKI